MRILGLVLGAMLALSGGITVAHAGAADGEMFGYQLGARYESDTFVEIFMGNFWVEAKDPVLPEGFTSLRLLVTPVTGTIRGMKAQREGAVRDLDAFADKMNVALIAQFGASEITPPRLPDGQRLGPVWGKDINGHWLALDELKAVNPPVLNLDFRYSVDNPKSRKLDAQNEKEAETYVERERANIREKEKNGLLRGIE